MHSLDHELSINASPQRVYRALTTPDGLRGWFSTGSEGSGAPGTNWDMAFAGSSTRFIWEITTSTPDTTVAWRCLEGPGDSPGTSVTFDLDQRNGGTLLRFSHSGWPHTEGNFVRCNTLWGGLLHRLADFAETDRPSPLYN
ncbi:MAG: SRPBCC domain-containing protein [Acidobacteria bacterium]|nr:SRPBCC domain-containing protein [Acidobacteriota bacterium]